MTLEPNWSLMRAPLNYVTIFLMVLFFVFATMFISEKVS